MLSQSFACFNCSNKKNTSLTARKAPDNERPASKHTPKDATPSLRVSRSGGRSVFDQGGIAPAKTRVVLVDKTAKLHSEIVVVCRREGRHRSAKTSRDVAECCVSDRFDQIETLDHLMHEEDPDAIAKIMEGYAAP